MLQESIATYVLFIGPPPMSSHKPSECKRRLHSSSLSILTVFNLWIEPAHHYYCYRNTGRFWECDKKHTPCPTLKKETLHVKRGKKPNGSCRRAAGHEVIMTQFLSEWGSAVFSSSASKPSRPTWLKPPQYLLLGLENLFSKLSSYNDEDNKGVSTVLSNGAELKKKKAGEITLKALPWSQANMLSPVTKCIGSV